uniref:Uncharacterized protein n=1 Tax=Rhizophora mucronata TaxID=61149 RepID=A0A2P2M221_RHIMU
MRIRSLCKII